MKSGDISTKAAEPAEEDDLFDMADLFPRTTGLPKTVWVSPRGNARHDVRIKVNMAHRNQMSPNNTVVVGFRPSPHMIAGRQSPDDEGAVFDWVALNSAAIIAYCDGDIDTVQLAKLLPPLPSGP
jgi:hypothetical protein